MNYTTDDNNDHDGNDHNNFSAGWNSVILLSDDVTYCVGVNSSSVNNNMNNGDNNDSNGTMKTMSVIYRPFR